MAQKRPYLSVRGVSKHYDTAPDPRLGSGGLRVLDNISFTAQKGEFVTIVGPNGCGKTTFFRMLAGLEDLDYGRIIIGGKTIEEAKISYIFQNYRESLYPWRTCMGNLMVPLELDGVPRRERKKKVEEFLWRLDMSVREDAYPYELSGGQQQMLSILRGLIYEPDILLLDEPFSSLDFQTTLYIHDKIMEIWEKTGVTILFISHNIHEAVYLADKVVVFSKRPARVVEVLETNFPRPRTYKATESDQFFEVRTRVMELFREEIMDSLLFMELSGF
ncbi:MAG: ABC transporter ATP-binding protein [Syntrophobacterales bacterium]|nr:MAG: ABC transporter ATP-binding protein [Syntrophobacterales bacterium]